MDLPLVLAVLVTIWGSSRSFLLDEADVEDLRAEADFRSVTLEWRMSERRLRDWPLGRATFRITGCEIQFWGAAKCRTQMMADSGEEVSDSEQSGPAGRWMADDGSQGAGYDSGAAGRGWLAQDGSQGAGYRVRRAGYDSATAGRSWLAEDGSQGAGYHVHQAGYVSGRAGPMIGWRRFRTIFDDLRLATNYTFEVAATGAARSARPKVITVHTKGFSGVSSQCLANSSRIEVETGPFFGGRIGVEDSADRRCYVDGDRSSDQSRYALVIDHVICGSWTNQSSVLTYVIVQENPSIVTHTARRFVVVCQHQPDVFVVESGIKMPVLIRDDEIDDANEIGPVVSVKNPLEHPLDHRLTEGNEVDEEEPSFSVGNTDAKSPSSDSQAQLVIMIGLLLATFIGLSAGTLVFMARQQNRRSRSSSAQPTTITLASCPPAVRVSHVATIA